MKNTYKFSVVVLTYNTPFDKLKRTVDSVITQSFDDFELVVSDDGSKEEHLDELEEYFVSRNFTNYQIWKNSENVGTVRHYYKLLTRAKGKYVKALGAGDYFCDNNCVREIYDFLEENGYKLGFGRMKKYRPAEDKPVFCGEFKAPKRMELYRNDKYEFLRKVNMLVLHDWISGAAMFGRRDTLIYYTKKLIGVSKYSDDIMQIFTIPEGDKFHLLDKYIIFYEWGGGVSTKKGKNPFREELKAGVEQSIDLAISTYRNHLLYILLLKIGKHKNSILKKGLAEYLDIIVQK